MQMLFCFRVAFGELVWWEELRHKGKGLLIRTRTDGYDVLLARLLHMECETVREPVEGEANNDDRDPHFIQDDKVLASGARCLLMPDLPLL